MAAFQNTIRMFDGLMYVVIVAGGIFAIKGLIMPADLRRTRSMCIHAAVHDPAYHRVRVAFQRGTDGIARFTELMMPTSIFSTRRKVPPGRGGEITFKHVSRVPNDHTPVPSDINLTIKTGEKVALVGPSEAERPRCAIDPRF